MRQAFSLLLVASLTALAVCAQDNQSVAAQSAGLESLTHGFYYKIRADEWKKLEVTTSSGFRTTHGASSLVGVAPGAVRFFDGSESVNQFDNGGLLYPFSKEAFKALLEAQSRPRRPVPVSTIY